MVCVELLLYAAVSCNGDAWRVKEMPRVLLASDLLEILGMSLDVT